jgi:hypothetical protein
MTVLIWFVVGSVVFWLFMAAIATDGLGALGGLAAAALVIYMAIKFFG